MRACLASLIFIFTITTAVAAYLDLPYWLLPPEQKFAHSWRHDLQLLERTKHFPEAWKNLNEVKFSSPDGFVEEWYRKTHSPFPLNNQARYRLEILALHQINGYRYSVMLQYNWTDISTGNTVGEFARTLKLGWVY